MSSETGLPEVLPETPAEVLPPPEPQLEPLHYSPPYSPPPLLLPAPRRGRWLRLGLGLALACAATLGLLSERGVFDGPAPEAANDLDAPAPRQAANKDGLRGKADERPGPTGSKAGPAAGRVVQPKHAGALFAQHSWFVLPKAPLPPPPLPPPPPPEPTAPPLPFTLVGSFAPAGESPVFFLSRGDRMIDAHVGDRIDGVYQLESASGGQLVFVYLPLNVRQKLAAGASQ